MQTNDERTIKNANDGITPILSVLKFSDICLCVQ